MELFVQAATLSVSAPLNWWLVCGVAISAVVIACHLALGGLTGTLVTDVFLALMSETIVIVALQSPLDIMHLHGRPLVQWSLALGTALAILGVLFNHLAQVSSHAH